MSRESTATLTYLLLWLALMGCQEPQQQLQAAQWPQFRGDKGQGRAENEKLPIPFGPNEAIRWQVNMGSGHSSPCVWGEKLFLTTFEEGLLQTLALDVRNGRLLWKQSLTPSGIEKGHRNGTPANSTPATNGKVLVTYFGSFGLAAYDLDGQEIWRKPLPVPVTQHGASSSPVLAGDQVILQVDQDVDSYLICLHLHTGETLWKVNRPGFRRGFATPITWPAKEPTSIITSGTLRAIAYALSDGTVQWEMGGLPNETVASPAFDEEHLFLSGWTMGSGVPSLPDYDQLLLEDKDGDGSVQREEATGAARMHFPYIDANKDDGIDRNEWQTMKDIFQRSENALLAIQPAESANKDPILAWKQTRGLPYVPSPLAYTKRIFLVKNGGMVSCLDASSGAFVYREERVGALGDYYASPIGVGNHVLIASQRGTITVLNAHSESLKVDHQIDFEEGIMATPAMVSGRLFVRTSQKIYCFERP